MAELCAKSDRGNEPVIDFEEGAARIRSKRRGMAEAASLAQIHGTNIYAEFVARHGHRPDRKQAATIGRLMGVQVRAADGTMQPARTKVEKKIAQEEKQASQAEERYIDQILKLRCALANLAEIESDPAVIISYMDPFFGDVLVIRQHLAQAVTWINRFAKEWGGEQEACRSPGCV